MLLSTYVLIFPPFQIIAMTFFIAFGLMAAKWLWRGENGWRYARLPPVVWIFALLGLFGYSFLLYLALDYAPAVEVSLLVNLWPLLMVLFCGLLPGEHLRWYHVLGCCIGFAGSLVLVGPAVMGLFDTGHLTGQLLALASGAIWAAFCVSCRAAGDVPTDSVGWFCLATALLGLLCHFAGESSVLSAPPSAWWAIVILGLGPIGLAFFAWDVGLKHGHIRLLGVMAFFIPMLSAVLLILAGEGDWTWQIVFATLLITGGACVAAQDELLTLVRGRALVAVEDEPS